MKHRSLVPFVLALSLFATVASAAKAPVAREPLGAVTITKLQLGNLHSTNATCQLGVLGTPTYTFDYFFPPNDNYLTYLNPADCTACGGAPLMYTVAHALLYFPSSPCPSSISVSVVGAVGDPLCRVPNLADVKCPALTYDVSVPAAGLYDVALSLPPGCCVTGDAFLDFTINALACNTSATRPRLVLQADCVPCISYNVWSGGTDEFCNDVQAPNPIMYADAECCQVVPTREKSWGRLKILYR